MKFVAEARSITKYVEANSNRLEGDDQAQCLDRFHGRVTCARDDPDLPHGYAREGQQADQEIAGRIARDSRTHGSAIVIAVTIAAVAGLGRPGGTQTFARLAARDKQRTANTLRALKARQP